MKLTAILKNIWFRSKKIIIGVGILVILLIIFVSYSCSRAAAQNNKAPPVSATGNVPMRGDNQIGGDRNTASGNSSGAELPDLAEAIARFSRETGARADSSDRKAFVEDFWRWIFGNAGIPDRIAGKVVASALDGPAFVMELLAALQQDPYTYCLVDKQHPLPADYIPDDLVSLSGGSYRVSRNDLKLRKIAAGALEEMAAAAAAEGIVLTAGSAYRSAAYQAQVYEREVKTYGQETADRESAQPGKSQHQLGLAVDFAPIDDAFAKTETSEWLLHNASRFGWSLSFPEGYENITGYRWESWHYRYVGRDMAAFINTYFEGIQQYAFQFIKVWQEN